MKSWRGYRARLDRVSALLGPPPTKEPDPFGIEPTIMRALVADQERLANLSARERNLGGELSELNAAERDELSILRASFPERLRLNASFMEGYGVIEHRRDRERFFPILQSLHRLSEREKEEARLRIFFFDHSPEAKVQARIENLQKKYMLESLTAAETTELAELEATNAFVPWDQTTWIGRWRTTPQQLEEERLRQRERAKKNSQSK